MGEAAHHSRRSLVRIGTGLDLPLSFATSKTAFLAGSGAGKTYTMTMIAEQFIRAGVQTVAVDPVSKWWGLTCNADGSPSGLPVVIIGGPRADLPLEWGRGKDIADVIVDHKITAILDLSDLDDDEQAIFVAEFSERLLFRKRKVNSVMHLFWDEVQDCAPEVPRGKYQSRMLGKVERLLKQIRNHGGGWTVGSQQPQAVSKRILNEATTIFAMRTPGAGNRAQIEKMLKDQIGDAEAHAVVRTLAKDLPKHHAKAWSMDFFDGVQTVEFVRKSTYDSSRTPEPGEVVVTPKKMAPAQLEKLRELLKESVAAAEANDPEALKAKNATLEEKIARLERAAKVTPVPPPPKPVEDLTRLRRVLGAFQKSLGPTLDLLNQARGMVDDATGICAMELANLGRAPGPTLSGASVARLPYLPKVAAAAKAPKDSPPPPLGVAQASMKRRHRQVLQTVGVYCRDHGLDGVEAPRVAGIIGMAFAGGFKNIVGELVREGHLERGAGGRLSVTHGGLVAVGGLPAQASSTGEVLATWREKLPEKAYLLLEELVSIRMAGGGPLPMDLCADHVKMALAGGFKNYVGKLRRFGLVTSTKGGLIAGDVLFPGGVA